jgi:hypothetical protein
MALSSLTAYTPIPNDSLATTGLWDNRFATLQRNIDQINNLASGGTSITALGFSSDTLRTESRNTISVLSSLEVTGAFVGTLSSNTQRAESGNTISTGTYGLSAATIIASAISVGIGGTMIPVISSMSSKVGAFIVAGSSSSFTGIAWPNVAIGDIIVVGVIQSAAVSSISSGLVPHSHVTVANQIEFRLSNVSTLVQNQSAQTWVFTRIRPF